MLEFFNELTKYALEAFNQGNPIALLSLFFISALTEIGVPFPFILDTVLVFAGFQTGPAQIGLIMLSLLLGRVIGASLIYWLTRIVGRVFVSWVSKRFPFLQRRMDWLTAKLSHNAPTAVAVARLTPGLLTPSTVAAGVIRLRYWHLVLGIAISSVIADGILLILGFGTGHGLERLGIRPIWFVVIALVLVIGLGWAIRRYFSRRKPE